MTDWKPTMLTASAPSGEMMTWINPSAIEQLQREVDALKAQAAPTPVEDEVTPEMCAAASRTWDKQTSWSSAATWTAVYRAMRAATAPEDEVTEASAELVALRARCERLAVVARWAEKARYAVSWPHQLGSALDALHPDDTEEAK